MGLEKNAICELGGGIDEKNSEQQKLVKVDQLGGFLCSIYQNEHDPMQKLAEDFWRMLGDRAGWFLQESQVHVSFEEDCPVVLSDLESCLETFEKTEACFESYYSLLMVICFYLNDSHVEKKKVCELCMESVRSDHNFELLMLLLVDLFRDIYREEDSKLEELSIIVEKFLTDFLGRQQCDEEQEQCLLYPSEEVATIGFFSDCYYMREICNLILARKNGNIADGAVVATLEGMGEDSDTIPDPDDEPHAKLFWILFTRLFDFCTD